MRRYVYLAEIQALHPSGPEATRASCSAILASPPWFSRVSRSGACYESRLPATLAIADTVHSAGADDRHPLGIYSAVANIPVSTTRHDTAFIGSSMPTFFFGLMFILIFSVLPSLNQDQFPWLIALPPGLQKAVRPYTIRRVAA